MAVLQSSSNLLTQVIQLDSIRLRLMVAVNYMLSAFTQ